MAFAQLVLGPQRRRRVMTAAGGLGVAPRGRRVAAALLDALFWLAPLSTALGFVVFPPPGTPNMGNLFLLLYLLGAGAFGLVAVLVVQTFVLSARRRTVGMAYFDLALDPPRGGRFAVANALLPLVGCLPWLDGNTRNAALSAIFGPLWSVTWGDGLEPALFFTTAFVPNWLVFLAPGGRTLAERLAGVRVVTLPRKSDGVLRVRRGRLAIDVVLHLSALLPILVTFIDFRDLASAAAIGLLGLVGTAVPQLHARATQRPSLGARACADDR